MSCICWAFIFFDALSLILPIFTTSDSCDRIKDEFQFLQAQYHSALRRFNDVIGCAEPYIYIYNILFFFQAEIVKRLNGICAQVIPFLSQEHQQQVVQAIERAKQVTAPELNTVIRQQLQAQQLSHLHGLTVPLTPLPAGLQPPVIPSVSASAGLLALSSALGSQIHLTTKDDKNHHDGDHQRDEGVQKPD
uniref:TLE family member 5, transcriptional modulator n=1 Tax=Callorhinchus milii TaxID=7868 RepID=A0A4W3HYZ8_CALMI